MSIYLTQNFPRDRKRRSSGQVAAAAARVFRDLFVLDTDYYPYGFAMAGNSLDFDKSDIRKAIRDAKPEVELRVYDRDEVLEIIGKTPPTSFDNLDIVWRLNVRFLPYEF